MTTLAVKLKAAIRANEFRIQQVLLDRVFFTKWNWIEFIESTAATPATCFARKQLEDHRSLLRRRLLKIRTPSSIVPTPITQGLFREINVNRAII